VRTQEFFEYKFCLIKFANEEELIFHAKVDDAAELNVSKILFSASIALIFLLFSHVDVDNEDPDLMLLL
jgi:hypothetical protein